MNLITIGDPKKDAVLLIHGFLGSAKDWDPIVAKLKEDFYCICIQLPGHAGEPVYAHVENYFEHLAQNCRQWLNQKNIKPKVCIGYSLGGRVALFLSQSIPFETLILLSTHPGIDSKNEKHDQIQKETLWANRLNKISLKEWLTQWYSQSIFQPMTNLQKTQLITKRLHQNPAHLISALKGFSHAHYPCFKHTLNDVHMLVGDYDEKYVHLTTSYCTKSTIIANSAHHLLEMVPVQVLEKILTIIHRQPITH